MTLFGKPISQYLSFASGFAVLVFVAATTRLILSLNGVPNTTTRWISTTVLLWICAIYFGVRVHRSGFGSYKQLYPAIMVPNIVAHAVIVTGIIIGILTGENNVFTSPEFFFNSDGKTWPHVLGHLTLGIFVGGLFLWLVGCLAMFVGKKLSLPAGSKRVSANV